MQYAAAWLLGTYRLEQGIEDLLDHIDLEEHRGLVETKMSIWGDKPAWEALVRFGRSALPQIIRRLAIEADDYRRTLLVRNVRMIEGTTMGLQALEHMRRKHTGEAEKAMLLDAIERLKREPDYETW